VIFVPTDRNKALPQNNTFLGQLARAHPTAIVFAILTFIAVMAVGMIFTRGVDRDKDAQRRAEWGHPVSCAISGRSDVYLAYGTSYRKVTITCPGGQTYHDVEMRQPLSAQAATLVWHNTSTGAHLIIGENGIDGELSSPDLNSNWGAGLAVATIAAALIAALFVASALEDVRTQLLKHDEDRIRNLPSPA
jgi:hypothetical protein